jgi:hypothetical protein
VKRELLHACIVAPGVGVHTTEQNWCPPHVVPVHVLQAQPVLLACWQQYRCPSCDGKKWQWQALQRSVGCRILSREELGATTSVMFQR